MKDYSGQRYGRLVFVKFSHSDTHRRSYWECKCDCGNIITARTDCVVSGNTKSCGCLTREPRGVKHGEAKTPLYHLYYSMKQRCCNPKDNAYHLYGGRGIKICDEWLNDYTAFSNWAKTHGYVKGLSIDRIDVNGNYEPSNCRWVTHSEQMRNTRRNTHITINGETKLLVEWCELTHTNMATACHRIKMRKPWNEVFNFPKEGVSTNCTPAIGTLGEAGD